MTSFLNYLSSIPLELYLLWGLRIGLILLIIGLLLPSPKGSMKVNLDVELNSKDYCKNRCRLVVLLDKITTFSSFRKFNLKTTSKQYKKIDNLINRSDCLKGLNPNMINFLKIISPLITFTVLLFSYLLKLSLKTTSLQQLNEKPIIIDSSGLNSFMQSTIITNEISKPHFSTICFMWIIVLSLITYMLPEKILKLKVKEKRNKLEKELSIVETFIIIMLETNTHTVYSILTNLLSVTKLFKPYIVVCLNEYYINPKQAIQNMADKIGIDEFQIICNGLKQSIDTDKQYTACFMKQHLEQLKKLQELASQKNIKQKPLIFVFLLALPLTSCIVIWFYPWFVRAMNMLATGF